MNTNKPERDRRFWAAVPIVFLLICAGVTVFHRYTEIGRGLSVDGLAMVGTTLFAAAAGFLAILYQVRSGSRQLREQLADQHQTSGAEAERQIRAVATAILFEIDLIYRSVIREVSQELQRSRGSEYVVKYHSLRFTVYEGNVGNIGQLPREIGQDIVWFYGAATRLVTTLQLHADAARNAHEARGNIDWGAMAAQYLEHTAKSVPWAKLSGYLTARRLCEYTKIEFKPPDIAVAAENLEQLQKECRLAEGSGTHPKN